MSRRTTDPAQRADERRASLSADVQKADALMALARNPEVVRWFDAQDRQYVDEILNAPTEIARVEAVTRVKALRDLRAHMTAIGAVADRASRRLQEMNENERQQNNA